MIEKMDDAYYYGDLHKIAVKINELVDWANGQGRDRPEEPEPTTPDLISVFSSTLLTVGIEARAAPDHHGGSRLLLRDITTRNGAEIFVRLESDGSLGEG